MSQDPGTYLWPTGHGGSKQATLQLLGRGTDMSGQSQQTQQLLLQQQQQFLQQQHQLQQHTQLLQQHQTHTQQHDTYQVIPTFQQQQQQATLRYNPYTTVATAQQTQSQTQAYTLSEQRIAWPQQARIGDTIISDSTPFSSDLTYPDNRGVTHYTVAQSTPQVNTFQQQMLQPAYYDYAQTQADSVQQITAQYAIQQPSQHQSAQHTQQQPAFTYHTYSISSTGQISANPSQGATLVKIEAPQGFQNQLPVNDSLTNPLAVGMAVRRRADSTPVLHPSKITTGGKPGLGAAKQGQPAGVVKQRTVSASTVSGVSPQQHQLARSSPQQRVLTGYVPQQGQHSLGLANSSQGLPYGVQVTRHRPSLGAMEVSPGLAGSYQLQTLPQSAGLHLATTGQLRQGDPLQTYLEPTPPLTSYTPGARAISGHTETMDTAASPLQSSTQQQPPLPVTPPAPASAPAPPTPAKQKDMEHLLGGGRGPEGEQGEEPVVVKIPRGVTCIEQIIEQWERGEGPTCPALKDWTIGMRRRERSIYSQRKKLYEEYQRLGSVEAFNRAYRDLPIGKVYAVVSSRNRKMRQEGSLETHMAAGQQTADEQDDDMSMF
eukprot:comp23537_c1_seq1/m.39661 comp23537_c1_seq1/g.39661  ORF comp23537_c1_seq1/g.39661 comp23537_c1_seq1/m.39661 type:complete len:600 (-) comp23537_c1_seq1:670-2469(-)